jgi:phage tail-like protein
MAAVSQQRGSRRLVDKYGFRIVSTYLRSDTAFVTGSELKITSEVIRYRAGGSLISFKSPGLADVEPFTCTRGATTGIHDLYVWKSLVVNGAAGGSFVEGSPMGAGAPDPSLFKQVIDVVQTNRQHQAIKRWKLWNAWPSELSVADGFDNNASEHNFESMTWEYDYFSFVDARTGSDISVSLYGNFLGIPFGIGMGSNTGLNFSTAPAVQSLLGLFS